MRVCTFGHQGLNREIQHGFAYGKLCPVNLPEFLKEVTKKIEDNVLEVACMSLTRYHKVGSSRRSNHEI